MSNYTNPSLRERLKNKIIEGSKGGKAGEWSARKAQLLKQEYEKAGGGYRGSKNSSQKSLTKWTKEEWGTKSGKNSVVGKKSTGERYLPKKARESLSPQEYYRTSAEKRKAVKEGKQYSKQPKSIAQKTAKKRK